MARKNGLAKGKRNSEFWRRERTSKLKDRAESSETNWNTTRSRWRRSTSPDTCVRSE
jgi:hypothetical protein